MDGLGYSTVPSLCVAPTSSGRLIVQHSHIPSVIRDHRYALVLLSGSLRAASCMRLSLSARAEVAQMLTASLQSKICTQRRGDLAGRSLALTAVCCIATCDEEA